MILYQYCIFFVKNLQYWNNFLYQYCQQYWYTSIVIAKYRRSVYSIIEIKWLKHGVFYILTNILLRWTIPSTLHSKFPLSF